MNATTSCGLMHAACRYSPLSAFSDAFTALMYISSRVSIHFLRRTATVKMSEILVSPSSISFSVRASPMSSSLSSAIDRLSRVMLYLANILSSTMVTGFNRASFLPSVRSSVARDLIMRLRFWRKLSMPMPSQSLGSVRIVLHSSMALSSMSMSMVKLSWLRAASIRLCASSMTRTICESSTSMFLRKLERMSSDSMCTYGAATTSHPFIRSFFIS